MNRRSRIAQRVAVAVSVPVVLVYAASALVLAGPKTPISFDVYATVASYMHPHFPQNWNLFAPDPISEERGALARYRCRESQAPTDWVNITARGVEKVQGSRFFPSRESRIVSNSIIARFRADDVLMRVEENDQQGRGEDDSGAAAGDTQKSARATAPIESLRKASTEEHEDVEGILARYASARHDTVCDGASAEQVQLRFVFHKFPGWSSRDDLSTTGEITTYDTQWITP